MLMRPYSPACRDTTPHSTHGAFPCATSPGAVYIGRTRPLALLYHSTRATYQAKISREKTGTTTLRKASGQHKSLAVAMMTSKGLSASIQQCSASWVDQLCPPAFLGQQTPRLRRNLVRSLLNRRIAPPGVYSATR